MVTSENSDSVLKAHLKCDEECDGLDRIVATIDVVTHEEVVGVGRLSTNLEQLTQVVELTVDVTAHRHGGAHFLHV